MEQPEQVAPQDKVALEALQVELLAATQSHLVQAAAVAMEPILVARVKATVETEGLVL